MKINYILILVVAAQAVMSWAMTTQAAGIKTIALGSGFKSSASGEFTFDTGVLRGVLRTQGKSLGLSSVIHIPSGQRLDRGNGLLSHYRVFTRGVRYGGGAWDWPSTAHLTEQGAVEVEWAASEDRPFEMRALYRWEDPSTLELITQVKAKKEIHGFESFLANYFDEAFTNCSALVKSPNIETGSGQFMPALQSSGDWLMFPRDAEAVKLIQDGRWKLEPHPVNWVIMPEFQRPLGFRRAPASGLTVTFASQSSDCFALATPHQTEAHYSLYLSQFGKDLKAGEVAKAVARMRVENIKSVEGLKR